MSDNGGRLRFDVLLEIEDFKRKVRDVKNKFSDMSGAAKKAGDALKASWTAMGGPILSVIGLATMLGKTIANVAKTNAEFERKSSELAAVLGTTKESVERLTQAAKELGRQTEFTSTEVEQLQISLARLGFTEREILNMQGGVLKFAAAVSTDLGSAADFAGSALRAFGLQSSDTIHLLDVMSASTSKSALDFSKLQTSISVVGPVANAFGLSVEDTVAFLGALSNAGFDASSAATALRNIVLNLADANGALAKGLGHTAKNFDEIIDSLKECTERGLDLNSALEMTDKRSVSAFSALINGATSARELRDALGDCNGSLDTMYDTMTDNLQGAVKGLGSAWEGLMLTMQNSNGVMKKGVDFLAFSINELTAAIEGTHDEFLIQEGIAKTIELNNKSGKNSFEDYSVALEQYKKDLDEVQASWDAWENRKIKTGFNPYNVALKDAKESYAVMAGAMAQLYPDEVNGLGPQKPSAAPEGPKGSNKKVLTDEEKKEIRKAAEELAKAERDMWIAANDAEIAAMNDGTEKKIRQIEQDRMKTIDAINKEQAEMEKSAKKAGKAVSSDAYAQLQARRDNANALAIRERAQVEKEQADYIAGLYRTLGDVFVGEEKLKEQAIRRTYEEQRKQLLEDLKGGTINASQYDDLMNRSRQAEKKQIEDSWVQSFGNYDQKLNALRDEWANRIKDVPVEFAEEANKQMQAAISDFIINNSESESAITRLFDDVTEKSVADLREIAREGQKLYDFLSGGEWDSSLGEKLGISKEQFDTIRKSPEELEKIGKAVREINAQADQTDNLFKQMASGLRQIVSAGNNLTKLEKGLALLVSGMTKATEVTGVLQTAFSDLAEGSGSEAMKSVADGLDVAMEAASSAMSGAQAGAAFGPWGAAAGAAIGLASSLYKNISKLHDENIQKKMDGLTKQMDSLSTSLSDISEKADDAFGQNRVQYLSEMNANLQRQNELIRQQMKLEESKKNADKDAIDDYKKAIEENNKAIEDNRKAAVDAVFGSDIQSAIEGFSDAITSAWEDGSKGAQSARDYARTMMKSMVSEAIKAYVQASGYMDRLRSALQDAMLDGVVSDAEKSKVEKMAEELANEVNQKYGWANDLFSAGTRSATAGAAIAASQESVNNLDARMTTMQSHTYSLMNGQQELISTSSMILQKVTEIEENTHRTAEDISSMRTALGSVRSSVEDMNTRGVRIKS